MGSFEIMTLGTLLTGSMLVLAARSWTQERYAGRRSQRLAVFAQRARPIVLQAKPRIGGAQLASASSLADSDDRVARWLPGAAKLRGLIARTGRPITLARFATWMAVTAAVVLAVAATVMRGSVVIPLVLAVVAGTILPRMAIKRMAKRRLAKFTAQFADAIDLIVRALRAGLPLSEALVTISNECDDPIGKEFRRVVGSLAIGRSIEEALWDIERTIDSAELRFFIISITTQIQTGGNLGETLGNLADILRQRSQMRLKVKAMTGEARASAAVLGSLPFIIAVLMSLTNPGYIAPLFTDPRGWVLLAGGAVMLSVGIGIMAKLVSFEI